jgi:3-deoxy-D-manno-octulosonate 8-phosphate phosphatase KdsC-like HAD superfamily phosphatase
MPHAGNRPQALREALATRDLSPGQLCYVGAQEAEQDCLRLAGCAILPADAPPSLASLAHLLSARDGLAQTLDWIIEALIREPARP